MKKPSSKIRLEITRLQEQLRQAETREAERIGRIALRAGLGETEIEEPVLQTAFEDLAKRFRGGKPGAIGKKGAGESDAGARHSETVSSGTPAGGTGEV